MGLIQNIKTRCQSLIDENGTPYGVPQTDSKPHIYSVDTITGVTAVDEVTQSNGYDWNGSTWEKSKPKVQDGTIIVPANVEIDIFHYAVHAKLGFTVDVQADINASEISVAFRTGSAAKYAHVLYKSDATAEAHFDFYCGGNMSISGGTDVEPVNRNQIPSLTASTMEGFATASWVANKVTLNPTITVGTAKVLRHFHLGAGRKIGGGDSAAWEFVLPAATICALVVNDDATAANLANLIVSWFEVPPAA